MMQRFKVAAGVVAFVLIALCAWGGVISNRQKNATPTPASAAAAPTPSPLIVSTAMVPTATGVPTAEPAATSAPVATQSREDRYLAIAQDAALPDIRGGMGVPAGEWSASVINAGAGPELQIRIPLNPAGNNAQFVRLAKQNIAQIVNALFVADPELARIAAIGTYPDQAGESPAVSVMVLRSASGDWGTVTAEQLDTVAERVDIKPEFR